MTSFLSSSSSSPASSGTLGHHDYFPDYFCSLEGGAFPVLMPGALFSLLVPVPLVRIPLPTRLLEPICPLEPSCLLGPSLSAGREPVRLPDCTLCPSRSAPSHLPCWHCLAPET